MNRLIVIAVDGHGSIVALSPRSGYEMARVSVPADSHEAHVTAARELISAAFEELRAQGYPNAREALWSAEDWSRARHPSTGRHDSLLADVPLDDPRRVSNVERHREGMEATGRYLGERRDV